MAKSSSSIDGSDEIVISVKVVPGSSRTESVGVHGQAYKIKIAAPPEKGQANKMLVDYFAKQLNIKKNAIQIKSGKTSSIKQISLRGVTQKDVQARFG